MVSDDNNLEVLDYELIIELASHPVVNEELYVCAIKTHYLDICQVNEFIVFELKIARNCNVCIDHQAN